MNKITLSEELKGIFRNAYFAATNMHLGGVTCENILCQIFMRIFDEDTPPEDKNPALNEYFKNMSGESKSELLDRVNDLFCEASTDIICSMDADLYDGESISVSAAFNYCILKAQSLTRRFFPEREGVLDTDVCLVSVLGCKDLFSDIKEEFGIDENDLLKRAISIDHKLLFGGGDFMASLLDPPTPSKVSKKGGDKGITDGFQISSSDIIKEIPKKVRNQDDKNFEKYGESEAVSGKALDPNSDTPVLDQFSEDMIMAAKNGKYDPVIGREDVVDSIIEVLCKRKKANVALLGVAGSGKSSIVERLAQRIVNDQVPGPLKGKRICSLNLNDLVAGTMYRGQYEERLQKIIKEICERKDIIVYIDELHNLVGSGSSSGNGDGANILKPYLARGEFQCIGSTTNEEYRKFIEKDAALNRRFTQIEVTEPTIEETVKILSGVKSSYEEFHHVKYGKGVIEACAEWSSRYISDKFQPDKAVDILDMSGSLANLRATGKEDDPEISEVRKKLQEVIDKKISAVLDKGNYDEGAKLRDEELKLREEQTELIKKKSGKEFWATVEILDVATAVSKISRVPVEKINQSEVERISKMKSELQKLVVGQDKAISEIVKALQRSWMGLRQPGKPIYTGLFVGNTGTGKTLICKEVARIFFGSEKKNLIRIDCGELKDKSSVSKLTGTTAGYIGYNDEPLLLQVKRTPNCVVLLDEIEKCDPNIYSIFMNILDEGYCTLGDGTRVDFTNSMIIFTGNVGTKELKSSGKTLGFVEENRQEKTESIVRKAIERTFRPEFINRLSSIVVFNELGKKEMGQIFNIEVSKIKKQMKKKKMDLTIGKEMKKHILDLIDFNYGARDMKRLLDTWIVDNVSDKILEQPSATKFLIDWKNDKAEVIAEEGK